MSITIANQLRALIFTPPDPRDDIVTLRLDPLREQMRSTEGGLDHLNLIFCGGGMSPASRERITRAVAALPRRASDLDRARCALELTVTAPDAAIQR